jgi:hypothetical protein
MRQPTDNIKIIKNIKKIYVVATWRLFDMSIKKSTLLGSRCFSVLVL